MPLVLLFTACTGQSQKQEQTSSEGTQEQAEQTQSQEIRTIDIIGIDQMKYVVKEEGEMIGTANTMEASNGETYLLLESIDASPGEQLRIRLKTVSNLPAAGMAHNWILLKMGVDPATFAQEALAAKANDYIPESRTNDIIAETGLAAAGETVEVTFTVPQETGNYDYLCSFPGHFAAGMKGVLNVQ
ncbi:MAG: plastocyanin/azurin family copper-binding protein [Gracilimonas sp.]|nr:plastocyanin/azurin family copper-binding protein [Gracilimonas sp.]